MAKHKSLKWKVGFVASLGVALLFHEVKASSAFEQAAAGAATPAEPMVAMADQASERQDASLTPERTQPQVQTQRQAQSQTQSSTPTFNRNQSSAASQSHTKTGRS